MEHRASRCQRLTSRTRKSSANVRSAAEKFLTRKRVTFAKTRKENQNRASSRSARKFCSSRLTRRRQKKFWLRQKRFDGQIYFQSRQTVSRISRDGRERKKSPLIFRRAKASDLWFHRSAACKPCRKWKSERWFFCGEGEAKIQHGLLAFRSTMSGGRNRFTVAPLRLPRKFATLRHQRPFALVKRVKLPFWAYSSFSERSRR